MAHIHTNPGDHDPTASAYIVKLDSLEPKLLLHVHKKIGKLLQPGGHIEVNENPWKAVLHEIEDETGYTKEQLVLFQPKDRIKTLTGALLHPHDVCVNTHPFPGLEHQHTDTAYAFGVYEEPLRTPQDGESRQLGWFTLEQLMALTDEQTFASIREIGSYVLTQCVRRWEQVDITQFAVE